MYRSINLGIKKILQELGINFQSFIYIQILLLKSKIFEDINKTLFFVGSVTWIPRWGSFQHNSQQQQQ